MTPRRALAEALRRYRLGRAVTRRGDYELVRVSRELVETIEAGASPLPAEVVGVKRFEDGTLELRVRRRDRGGRELRVEVLAAAAQAVVDSSSSELAEAADRSAGLFQRNLRAVNLPALRRLEAAIEALGGTRPVDLPEAELFGRLAFSAYTAAKDGVAHDGDPIPPWEHLGEDIRQAWIAAGYAAALAGAEA